MERTRFLAAIAMLTAFAGTAAVAGDAHHARQRDRPSVTETHRARGAGQGMLAVPNHAGPPDSGHGWQYFSDPAALRAVVISPQGDYYYSRGKGLRWVAGSPSSV